MRKDVYNAKKSTGLRLILRSVLIIPILNKLKGVNFTLIYIVINAKITQCLIITITYTLYFLVLMLKNINDLFRINSFNLVII